MSGTEDTRWAVDAGIWSAEMSFEQAVGWVIEHLTRHPGVASCNTCGVTMMSSSQAGFGNTIIVRRSDLPL